MHFFLYYILFFIIIIIIFLHRLSLKHVSARDGSLCYNRPVLQLLSRSPLPSGAAISCDDGQGWGENGDPGMGIIIDSNGIRLPKYLYTQNSK